MDWLDYKSRFISEAKRKKKSDNYCNKWLAYAEILYNRDIPIIYSQEHFCKLVGYSESYIYSVSNSSKFFYRHYQIPKKNGNKRDIYEPLPNLKDIQHWILNNILYHIDVSPYAKAYVPGKNIKENVKFHKNQKIVLSLDVKDFYDNLSEWNVYKTFLMLGYSDSVSVMLSKICCLNGHLPQGAPTSAALSNILLKSFDFDVYDYCNRKKIRFTRYADDMTFSGDFDVIDLINFIKRRLKDEGLKLNSEKTRVRKQGQQQEVTGIIVNKKIQLAKDKRKDIRKNMYYISKYGLQSHLDYIGENRKNYVNHLLGIVSYALFLNPKDKELEEYKKILTELLMCENKSRFEND